MATATAEQAVRTYLTALKDPSALRDENEVAQLERQIDKTDDHVERLVLRQQLLEAKSPALERYEEGFVKHAKKWADDRGVTAEAFASEGVPPAVLRRAGFRVRGGRKAAPRKTSRARRSRVSADDVRKAIPRGTFTVKRLEESTGASPAVVRKVVQAEVEAGNLTEVGPDPDHRGPGRAPTLYKKK